MQTMHDITLVGQGPVTFSTARDLALSPEIIFDVNGYYRELGVPVRATRGQISKRYQQVGTNSARLTYIIKQLLNPSVRREYDMAPMGSVFMDDYVMRSIRSRAAEMGLDISVVAEVINETQDTPVSRVDKQAYRGQYGSRSQEVAWEYPHYTKGSPSGYAQQLSRWQGQILSALADRGVRMQIAVGVLAGPEPLIHVSQIRGNVVAMVHEDAEITKSLIDACINQIKPAFPETQTKPTERDLKMSKLPAFRRGTEEAQSAAKNVAFARTHYFTLSADKDSKENTAIVRFLTDHNDIIVVNQHANIPTKSAPAGSQNWPEKMSAVCRADRAFEGMYADCFICDNIVNKVADVKRPSARSWALAVLREAVMEDGKVLGYRDAVREVAEVDDKGNQTGTRKEKAVVVVNMAYRNFFSILEGFGKHYGTILDRDYRISRSGERMETSYSIIPLDQNINSDGSVFDLRKPEDMARYELSETLEDVVIERSTDEFYGRFFDTRVSNESKSSGASNNANSTSNSNAGPARQAAPQEQERPGGDNEQSTIDALASRIMNYSAVDKSESGDAGVSGMRNF